MGANMNPNCKDCAYPCAYANNVENGPADCVHCPYDETVELREENVRLKKEIAVLKEVSTANQFPTKSVKIS
jgi:hypothetical protein